jgi:anaerobic selenocysteine-containing dehydrogenase
VIDPRRTETAEIADIHLQVRPSGDAWLVAAIIAVLVQEDLLDHEFLAAHAVPDEVARVVEVFGAIPVAEYCARAGVDEALVRDASRAIGKAERLASMEDLGVQMNRHSTLLSYLHRLLFLLTGNLGKKGTHYIPSPLVAFAYGAAKHQSPVAGARIVSGLVPCNVIAEEILTDHPKRYRAMIIEATNPVHSVADSKRMREALASLDTVVVIDVAMSESARAAHYILPAASQFEKAEATFFNFEFPNNYFHLRPRLFPPPEGLLPEAEIHARLCEALGVVSEADYAPLREAAKQGLEAYAAAFMMRVMGDPRLSGVVAVVLYRTLGPALPAGLEEGAVLLGLAFRFAMEHGGSLARAGFGKSGNPADAARELFEAILASPSGLIFASDEWPEVTRRIATRDKKLHVALDDMLEEVAKLAAPADDVAAATFPFVLSAGERRSFTANTIIRDPSWRRKDAGGALRISPADAASLGVTTGDRLRLVTPRDRTLVAVEVSDTMQRGHISLPNGLGLSYPDRGDDVGGIPPNELTSSADRDPFVGTPWHKSVPARLEALDG